jgi:predicted ArsR family transcriptional regulator
MSDKACEYFKRSFFAIDGLWFMMNEDDSSFEKALMIDEQVWKVLSKIQSRKLRELYEIKGNSLRDLLFALEIKLELEGYKFTIEKISDNNAQILIQNCPWFDIMLKAGREKFAGRVGEKICDVEYKGWTNSFDNKIKFNLGLQLCRGEKMCQLKFQLKS